MEPAVSILNALYGTHSSRPIGGPVGVDSRRQRSGAVAHVLRCTCAAQQYHGTLRQAASWVLLTQCSSHLIGILVIPIISLSYIGRDIPAGLGAAADTRQNKIRVTRLAACSRDSYLNVEQWYERKFPQDFPTSMGNTVVMQAHSSCRGSKFKNPGNGELPPCTACIWRTGVLSQTGDTSRKCTLGGNFL
jgi:hypothetical protein